MMSVSSGDSSVATVVAVLRGVALPHRPDIDAARLEQPGQLGRGVQCGRVRRGAGPIRAREPVVDGRGAERPDSRSAR